MLFIAFDFIINTTYEFQFYNRHQCSQ